MFELILAFVGIFILTLIQMVGGLWFLTKLGLFPKEHWPKWVPIGEVYPTTKLDLLVSTSLLFLAYAILYRFY